MEQLLELFSELDRTHLTNYIRKCINHQSPDQIADYIATNYHMFPNAQKVEDQPVADEDNELEVTQNLSSSGETSFVDVGNKDLQNGLQFLLEMFEEEALEERVNFDIISPPPQQVEECITYMASKFSLVRVPLIRDLFCRATIKVLNAAILLFFTDNDFTASPSTKQLIDTMVKRYFARKGPFAGKSIAREHLKPLKRRRNVTPNEGRDLNEEFKRVIDNALNQLGTAIRDIAISANPEVFRNIIWLGKPVSNLMQKEEGPTFVCEICFEEQPTTKGISCTKSALLNEGSDDQTHQFCLDCVRGQAKAATEDALVAEDGQGISCMAQKCKNSIRFVDIKRYISRPIRKLLAKRIDDNALLDIDNVEKCLKCGTPMVIDVPPDMDKVFKCPSCRYEFCRVCEGEWKKHFGYTCEQMKRKNDDDVLRAMERKKNEVIVRKCPRCLLQFVKESSCNKMTCRCGMTMCYICRTPRIGYDHFCNHFRDPNRQHKGCQQCNKCLLWEDPRIQDEAVLKQIENEAGSSQENIKPGRSTRP